MRPDCAGRRDGRKQKPCPGALRQFSILLRETTGLHLTLRELKTRFPHICPPDGRLLAVWCAVSVICIIAGPFGTDEVPIVRRSLYWFGSNLIAIAMSLTIIGAVSRAPVLTRFPVPLRLISGALVFATAFSGVMTMINVMVFGFGRNYPDFLELFWTTALIAIAITFVIFTFESSRKAAPSSPSVPRFLRRLKPGLGHELVRLAMQDHYVEVHTERGRQLILMRFADALDELDGIAGWRLHRSHWIAAAGIADIKRKAGKTVVVARDGAELPVSRTYLPTLKDAGILKRFLG